MPPRARECLARVVARRPVTPDVLEVDLDMVDPPALEFLAGQWLSISFGPRLVRAYSVASTPRTPGRLTLCADVAPGGLGSTWLRSLTPGAEVRFKGPLGGLVLDPADTRRLLFVAEEIGIVPVRSILAHLSETGSDRPACLVYGARDPSWLVYDAELRSRSGRLPRLAYHPVVQRAGAGWTGELGMVADLVDRLVTRVDDLAAYVVGGGVTVDRVRSVLGGKGLDRKAVRWEKFW